MERHNKKTKPYSIKNFLPLIVIFAVIIVITYFLVTNLESYNTQEIFRNFMGVFFLIFGLFKIVNLKGFVKAYQEYDVIAKRNKTYGYLYPFIELGLGIAYLISFSLPIINWITLAIMLVSGYGVFLKLRQREVVPCACLGVVFKIPMTWVTLGEDALMALMAIGMIVN